jgi:DNA-binding NarL/FixJ family response regulator
LSIRVLVVDDHPLIRDALTELFAETPDIEVVGTCADGSEVVDAVVRTGPDVVLMDLQMPQVDGIEATRRLRNAHPGVRVVVLTGALTPATVHEARSLGVAGYLLKEDDPGALPDRVRSVAAGGTAWCAAALEVVETGAAAGPASSTYAAEAPRRFQ